MTARPIQGLAFLLLIGSILLAGCSHDPIVGTPTTDGGTDAPAKVQFLSQPPSVAAPQAGVVTEVSRFIRARDGGDLVLSDITVRIPRNSLPSDLTLTLRRVDGDEVRFVVIPSDIVLALPATISVGKIPTTTTYRAFESLTVLRVAGDAPTPLSTIRSPDRVEATSPALGEFVIGEMNSEEGTIEALRYLRGAGYLTQFVQAVRGGEVRYDRYKLTFPPGALSEDTYITIRNSGSGYVMCELEPHGIQFLQPVALEMDLRGLNYQPYYDWSIYWLNQSTGLWEDERASFVDERVRTSLPHFSTYATGRGGW